MKISKLFYRSFFSFLILILIASSSWAKAKLVVTDETRAWAKKVIEEEKSLTTVSKSNTVAVIDFYNKTEWDKLDSLQKGLALMLMTDLSKVKSLQLVERAKFRALSDELALRASLLVDPGTKSRLGKLLGVEHVVGGDILKGKVDRFQLNSNLLRVRNAEVFGQPKAEGMLLEGLFEMEKTILFEIIKELKIALTPEEKEALGKHITLSLPALLYLFRAVEAADQGDYETAVSLFEKALEEDPDLELANDFLIEIADIMEAPDYPGKRAEGYSEEAGHENIEYDEADTGSEEDPPDRENDTDSDGDGYTVNGGDCYENDASIYPGATEIPYDGIDQDCDGSDLTDVDGDGHDAEVVGGDDCNDNDASIYPGAAEIPYDGIDQDCSGSDLTDVDLDGYSIDGGDCNDNDASIYPGATEIPYDGIDQDCDGSDLTDVDGDGHDAEVVGGDDCNDNDASIYAGATEIPYDGIDQDCDESDLTDVDGDGYDAIIAGGTDCDDNDAGINPGAAEILYDGIDQDCNGSDGVPDYLSGVQPPFVDPDIGTIAWQNYQDPDVRVLVDSGFYVPGIFNPDSYTPDPNFSEIQDWGLEWSGAYKNGLQLVGTDVVYPDDETWAHTPDTEAIATKTAFIEAETLLLINSNTFLAYEVQLEEDNVNRAILELYQESIADFAELDALWNDIDSHLDNDDIRTLDNYMLEKADAQSGRVLMDRNGHWVRVQQYILRPNEETVSVLNVCLRGSDLSSMDFTTKFTAGNGYPILSDLRHLPWHQWLDTRHGEGDYVELYFNVPQGMQVNWNNVPELASMYVKFINPAGESLKEERFFGNLSYEGSWGSQSIYGETLTISGTADYSGSFNIDNLDYPDPTDGFDYYYTDDSGYSQRINVSFFSLADINGNNGSIEINSIWDALRVNESAIGPFIGNNNLEIVISNKANSPAIFTQDIDVIYIPMSRMVWKGKDDSGSDARWFEPILPSP